MWWKNYNFNIFLHCSFYDTVSDVRPMPWPSIISKVGHTCEVPTTNISSNHVKKSYSSMYLLGDFPYKQPSGPFLE